MGRYRGQIWPVFFCIVTATAAAHGQLFEFQIDPANSGGTARLHVSVATSGTLVGSYVPVDNPTGTRTRAGFLFAPGATQNDPIPVQRFDPDAEGDVTFKPTGRFLAHLDPAAGVFSLTDLSLDLLGSGEASIPVSAAVAFSTFRTASPGATFFGIPLNLPLGDATVSSLTVESLPEPAIGTLTSLGGGRYSFNITPTVIIRAAVEFQGNPLDFATDPLEFPLIGEVLLNGDTAMLTEAAPINFTNAVTPAEPLPEFPFDLPTGGVEPAHVLLNLTLNTQSTSVVGNQRLAATGVVVVPEPGLSLAAAVLGVVAMCRPRRRRAAVTRR